MVTRCRLSAKPKKEILLVGCNLRNAKLIHSHETQNSLEEIPAATEKLHPNKTVQISCLFRGMDLIFNQIYFNLFLNWQNNSINF